MQEQAQRNGGRQKKGKPGFGGNQAFLAFQRGPMMGVTAPIGKRVTRLRTLEVFAPPQLSICLKRL